ncbi:hypothetical protein H6P81_019100 [Aristolochia fimbriata]|uniref:Uncharacterized protein n=1 Tax=Aristolochia fimbriata TaxID=158543 RepID=A0AAV7DQS9_ARIFI|nr:hypothetical protein H6P81_019100 [Aristolochia fimbriata]
MIRSLSGPHYNAVPMDFETDPNDGSIFIPAKALNIVWGNDKRYWNWSTTKPEEGVQLVQVNWIQVTGSVDCSKLSSPIIPKTYEIIWEIKFNVDAFGWKNAPVKFKVATDRKQDVEVKNLFGIRKESGQWHQVQGGEFVVDGSCIDGKINFGMFETESDWWKGGMVLRGVRIRSKK